MPRALQGDPLAIGFALIDDSTPYADLFDSTGIRHRNSIMLDFSEFFDFDRPTIDAIAAYLIANGTLPDFTGEGEGQIYRVDTGEFVIPGAFDGAAARARARRARGCGRRRSKR